MIESRSGVTNMSEFNRLGILIKKLRLSKGLTVEKLAQLACYSRGYISQIENGIVDVDENIYSVIFKTLGVNYKKQEDTSEYNIKLDNILHEFLYLNIDLEETKTIIEEGKNYKYSVVYHKYLIVRLAYYVLYKANSKNVKIIVEEMEKLVGQYDSRNQQIIYDYIGCYYLSIDNNKALSFYKKAIDLGAYDHATSLLAYHLGMYYYRTNNYCRALIYCLQALELFGNEMNFKRIYYTKLHIAILLSKNGDYEEAINEFILLLKVPNITQRDICVIYSNICWTYIKSKNYEEALRFGLLCNAEDDDEYYYHLALIYFNLCKRDEVSRIIKEGIKFNKNNSLEIKRLSIIKMQLDGEDKSEKYVELLKEASIEVGNKGDLETIEMIYNNIIKYYKNKHQYKDAFKYLQELTKIKS